jgi:demethylmenaquinone methyltransferase/2-methoxy-6-polyprenyl-1,4-benzoquinol methylase
LLNTVLSFGLHHLWRRRAADLACLTPGDIALDVCTGTGDFALELCRRVGPQGAVVGVDFCEPMLQVGLRKHQMRPGANRCAPILVLADAMQLPFPDNQFSAATVGFGVRNVEDIQRAFAELARVVRPGGKVVCLELARPRGKLFRALYAVYFKGVLPWIGKLIHGRRESYAYLPESLARFPERDELAAIMRRAGLADVSVLDLTAGIVAVHSGRVP